MSWPPDYLDVFNSRIKRLRRIKGDEDAQSSVWIHYKNNPVDFINDWCVTYDPRKKPPNPKLMPFILFPRQVELVEFVVECIMDGENGQVEKCRDAGVTWICCAVCVWLMIFHDDTASGWGSRKEEYVDKLGDPKAIFPKIRQILDNLPPFLSPSIQSSYMKIINSDNGSITSGEAGDNIGRGGRTTVYFKDESAHYERPELVEAALGDNTDCQIDISSVNGTNNVFYRRRMAGEVWERGKKIASGVTRVFIFDWRDHPDKTQEWYDKRRKKAEAEGLLHVFKQEVDRDYVGSQDSVIIPMDWINAAVDAHLKLDIDITGDKVAGQDIADGGGDKNAIVVRHGIVAQYADHWGGEAGEAANVALPICTKMGVTRLGYDSIGVGSAFKTRINTLKELPAWPKKLMVEAWEAGAKVKEPFMPSIINDSDSPKNKDVYHNWKAQAWYRVRQRFYKTYLAVTSDDPFDEDELISLDSKMPGLHQLKLELAQVKQKTSATGKILVDKKPNGATSPNLADAFIICYNPVSDKKDHKYTRASDYS